MNQAHLPIEPAKASVKVWIAEAIGRFEICRLERSGETVRLALTTPHMLSQVAFVPLSPYCASNAGEGSHLRLICPGAIRGHVLVKEKIPGAEPVIRALSGARVRAQLSERRR
jgi:hypothetical protein